MAAGDITIRNSNVKATYGEKLWQTGMIAATTDDSLQTKAHPALVVPAANGEVKVRFWETDQYFVLSAYNGSSDVAGTGNNDGNTITIAVPTAGFTEAEKAYYNGLNGVAGLEVTTADS
jgi:hypothetical protein